MGQYLKQQYKEREIAKSLAKVHGLIDEDGEKLYDKIKELKLSHNRMRKLLKLTLKCLESCPPFYVYDDMGYLHKRITLELYGLENYKGIGPDFKGAWKELRGVK